MSSLPQSRSFGFLQDGASLWIIVFMSQSCLFVFTHPFIERSRANKAIVNEVKDLPFVRMHSLYDLYPYFDIDAEAEKALLLQHDLVVFQHPFYWYNVPPLLKLWQDEVLELNWAYGPNGNALRGKDILVSVTTGGSSQAYQPAGQNRFTMETLLSPWNQTAHLCGMNWLDPYILHHATKVTDAEIHKHARGLRAFLIERCRGDRNHATP